MRYVPYCTGSLLLVLLFHDVSTQLTCYQCASEVTKECGQQLINNETESISTCEGSTCFVMSVRSVGDDNPTMTNRGCLPTPYDPGIQDLYTGGKIISTVYCSTANYCNNELPSPHKSSGVSAFSMAMTSKLIISVIMSTVLLRVSE